MSDRGRSSGSEREAQTAPSVPIEEQGVTNYLVLYGALYLAYGTESAFLPAFLVDHGVSPEQVAQLLAIWAIVRIVASPFIGRLADHFDAQKGALCVAACLSGCIGWAYGFAFGFFSLFVGTLLAACATTAPCPL